ncbi:GNAT family N-acetyltransferase [Nocardioides dongxiaopingii]|uniref:GNAT family N-acetyltransferase n=1 Tax=Nocardioides sp. S-1144 TaxID=2582905 RepID=UPI00110DF81F|nr:GNAT family N-acetyltransferase [Nocardioides sp. S-1144]QCW50481.1 GNAT family N-acetyltransferase [Nocardioides sp. S-1144]
MSDSDAGPDDVPYDVRVVDLAGLRGDAVLAAHLATSRGPLWRVEALSAMEEETRNRVWLAVATRSGPAGDALVAGILLERVLLAGGIGHVHHPHSGSEPSYWSEPGHRGALPLLVGALRRRLGPRMPALLWRQVGDDDVASGLPGRRLVQQTTLPLGVVDLDRADAEAWLQSLGRSRRQDLRRLRRRLAEDVDLDVTQGPLAEVAKGEEVAPLLDANFSKHNPRRHPLMNRPAPAAWLDVAMADHDLQAVAYRDRGVLSAVGLMSTHRGVSRWLSWGADYEGAADRRGLYYDCTRRIVELSYAAASTTLVLGKGKGELKSSFGARLEGQRAVVRTPI